MPVTPAGILPGVTGLVMFFLTERQWHKVLPLIREGAKELEIHLDDMGNAVVVSMGARIARPPLKLRGNVIPFPYKIQTKTTRKEQLKKWLQKLGVVFWGEDDDEESND